MSEGFRPVNNTPPATLAGKIKFYGRMVLDLQILTIYRDIKKLLPTFKGNVLDVGCGQSPYKFLLDEKHTKYFGIDIVDADKFDYHNTDITPFDGSNIPFENEMFDGVICTEVLEHVQNYQLLINEMYRVTKKGGTGIATVPWSARFHYKPHDYFRYTPSSLKSMFAEFKETKIAPRGSDIPTIANKLIVMWFRNMFPGQAWKWLLVPLWVLGLPVLAIAVILAHVALWFKLGSDEDPLGYTVIFRK